MALIIGQIKSEIKRYSNTENQGQRPIFGFHSMLDQETRSFLYSCALWIPACAGMATFFEAVKKCFCFSFLRL